ncbi:carboxymuconolactone decarboxylase family protein [Clostridium puniceum]|uniref:Carboxymuconolactone decarboxylase family protein n=1 Tax=Clostridium puniceum TaxID=29367 RepID=A0A1S8TMM1_9CLOT|nr:carboxymuconolactone decarboxylase family protein [Clostridium puniceum]OOM79017.1 carboxymuconolactone decarboxylase family protein [Clostridium puniceum]
MEPKEIMKIFSDKLPQVQGAFANMMQNISESSTIDAKTRELVMVALLTAQKSPFGVKAHGRRALDEGASIEDIISVMSQAIPIAGIGAIMDCLPVVVELEDCNECRNS